ncbi:SRPBCC family protein, partial [Lentzea sp. BCCO 10_0856]
MSIKHASFTIERTYAASIDKVWQAWADQASKAKWFVSPDAWESNGHTLDFRENGTESVAGTAPDGTVHTYNALYQDIQPNQRIVSTYTMHANDKRTSVSLATVEFDQQDDKTTITVTEHGAFFDGLDRPEWREQGTNALLDALGKSLT